MNPTAAVIIPCWNGESSVGRAIASAQAQDLTNLDVIVVDDGSDDGILAAIKAFGDAIRWTSDPNAGASTARNRGLRMSAADYVLFLDADDYLQPASLPHWVETARHENADVVLGPFAFDTEGRLTAGRRPPAPVTALSILRGWLEGLYTPCCAVLWRREFLEAIGGWDEHLLRNDDGELAMRAMILGAKVATADAGLGVYVQHTAPGRISHHSDADICACELNVLESLWALADERGIQAARPSFARAFYRVAYGAYAIGAEVTGRAALARARALGFAGHLGSVTHKIASRALGLKRKMQLAAMARSALGGRASG
jgi:cellulose synthase/poly-beta-1,6-N-acetylglucosamine synthase-like glycosyltransferase